MRERQVNSQLVEHRVTPPDEHAAVPVVLARFNVAVGGRFVRLFFEGSYAKGAAGAGFEFERLAAMNIAKAGVAMGRNDAESDQRIGIFGGDFKAGAKRCLE